MPILEKACISLYLGIFRLTAAATATSQELWTSGKAPGPSRAGSKYPVRESLTSINSLGVSSEKLPYVKEKRRRFYFCKINNSEDLGHAH